MKQILIICDGILAKHFLERVFKIKNVLHNYVIIAKSDEFVPQKLKDSENFLIHSFDPTSLEKLRQIVIESEFMQCIVVMESEFDTKITTANLKEISPELELYIVDFWGFAKEYKNEDHIKVLNALSLCSSRLIGFLPDSPIYADNIGIGKGEIMEVKVPIGSSYAYKKVGLLTAQGKFQIPMIYRHNSYIVTNANTVIMPNDSILVVGEPSALRTLFRTIKKQIGQFPSPFGLNLYALIDMKNMSKSQIEKILQTAQFLNENLQNHKLFVRILNPTINETFENLKMLKDNDKIEILIDYSTKEKLNFLNETQKYNIGLIITENSLFEMFKDKFYILNIPILTTGECDFKDIAKSVVVTAGANATEESSVIFDISAQLNLDIYLYFFNQNLNTKQAFIENYKNLAKLFRQKLHICDDSNKNPILTLCKDSKFLQFIPFDEKILGKNLTAAFSKDLDLMYPKLKNNYQIFIPSGYEYENL